MADNAVDAVIGASFSGEELEKLLPDGVNERIWAIGNEKEVFIALDEGNDNYKVLAKVTLKG